MMFFNRLPFSVTVDFGVRRPDGLRLNRLMINKPANSCDRMTKPIMTDTPTLTEQQRTELEAAAFRRLLSHLDNNKQVQNIDLMNLAGFCRNCLAKWYAAEATDRGLGVDYEQARQIVYGMPYSEWKEKYQTPVSGEKR